MDFKHVEGEETKEEKEKPQEPKFSEWVKSHSKQISAVARMVNDRMRKVEAHLVSFAHMSMADTVLSRTEALSVWLEMRRAGFNFAPEGGYSLAEMIWILLCLDHVARQEPKDREYMRAVHIPVVFREMCAMGRRVSSKNVSSEESDKVFGRAASVVQSVLTLVSADDLLVQLGVDGPPPGTVMMQEAIGGKREEKKKGVEAEEAVDDSAFSVEKKSNENDERKRVMDVGAVSTEQLKRDADRMLEISPLDSIPKAVQGFILFGSRIFWHTWARHHIQSLFPFEETKLSGADVRAFETHMTALCDLEMLLESSTQVVQYMMRANTIVGSLPFLRRHAIQSNETFNTASIIQTEVSGKEYDRMMDDASRTSAEIWADQKSEARESLLIETMGRQVSYQIPSSVASSKTLFYSTYCLLHDEVLDGIPQLCRDRVGSRMRRPIIAQLPRGFAVHHNARYLICDPPSFQSAVITWMRLIERDFQCKLMCGTSIKTMVDDFLNPPLASLSM